MTISQIIRREIDKNIGQMSRIKRFTQPEKALNQLLFLFIKEKAILDNLAKSLEEKEDESIFDFESDFKKRH